MSCGIANGIPVDDVRLLMTFMDNTPDRIYFKDLQSRFILGNRALAGFFGVRQPEEVIGKTDFDFFSEEHAKAAFDDEQNVIKTGQAIINKEEKETWPDGRITWSSSTKFPLLDERGQTIGTFGMSRDITGGKHAEATLQGALADLDERVRTRTAELARTNDELRLEVVERKRAEEKLQEVVRRLRILDEARSKFVSNVSHEIKTPLASLRFAIDNLLKGVSGPVSEVCRAYLAMMKRDADRVMRTIFEVLDLSRIEANTLVLNTRRVRVSDLVRQTVESLKIHADAKQQQLTVQTGGHDELTAEWDADKMERVVLNVVENAIKYTPKGGTVSVTVRHDGAPEGIVVLEVVDNGIGIAPQHIDRVTDRYFRVGEQVGGAGLGLSITREIVQRHGGWLKVASPPCGETCGTQVSLHVPVAPPQALTPG